MMKIIVRTRIFNRSKRPYHNADPGSIKTTKTFTTKKLIKAQIYNAKKNIIVGH